MQADLKKCKIFDWKMSTDIDDRSIKEIRPLIGLWGQTRRNILSGGDMNLFLAPLYYYPLVYCVNHRCKFTGLDYFSHMFRV